MIELEDVRVYFEKEISYNYRHQKILVNVKQIIRVTYDEPNNFCKIKLTDGSMLIVEIDYEQLRHLILEACYGIK